MYGTHRNDREARGDSLIECLCGQHPGQPPAAIFLVDLRVVENPLVRPDVVHVSGLADHGVGVEHFETAALRVVPDGDRGQHGLLLSAWARFGLPGGAGLTCWCSTPWARPPYGQPPRLDRSAAWPDAGIRQGRGRESRRPARAETGRTAGSGAGPGGASVPASAPISDCHWALYATISSWLRPTKFHHITIFSPSGSPPIRRTRAPSLPAARVRDP